MQLLLSARSGAKLTRVLWIPALKSGLFSSCRHPAPGGANILVGLDWWCTRMAHHRFRLVDQSSIRHCYRSPYRQMMLTVWLSCPKAYFRRPRNAQTIRKSFAFSCFNDILQLLRLLPCRPRSLASSLPCIWLLRLLHRSASEAIHYGMLP